MFQPSPLCSSRVSDLSLAWPLLVSPLSTVLHQGLEIAGCEVDHFRSGALLRRPARPGRLEVKLLTVAWALRPMEEDAEMISRHQSKHLQSSLMFMGTSLIDGVPKVRWIGMCSQRVSTWNLLKDAPCLKAQCLKLWQYYATPKTKV